MFWSQLLAMIVKSGNLGRPWPWHSKPLIIDGTRPYQGCFNWPRDQDPREVWPTKIYQNYLEFHQTFRCDFHGLWIATQSCLSVLPLFPWNCGWKRESWYLAIASIKMYQLFTHGLIRSSPLWLGHFAILSFKNPMSTEFIFHIH